MNFTSHSQAGQDLWVLETLGNSPKTFLDIGCNHPIDLSNTYGLELIGWRGLLVDNDAVACEMCRKQRINPVLEVDATKVDWSDMLFKRHWIAGHGPFDIQTIDFSAANKIGYLSLDVDHATEKVLAGLLAHRIGFQCATIENDFYRFGPGPRERIRQMMLGAGYILAKADVEHQGCIFEDWWISKP